MKQLAIGTAVFCFALACVVNAEAQAEQAKPPQFFVAPIETEVQRREISGRARAYAVVNCNAFLVGSQFDPNAFDTTSLVSELRTLADADAGPLKLMVRFHLGGEIGRPTVWLRSSNPLMVGRRICHQNFSRRFAVRLNPLDQG